MRSNWGPTVLLGLTLVACGVPASDPAATWPPPGAPTLADCPDPDGDWPPPSGVLADADRWLEVERFSDDLALLAEEAPMAYRPVRVDAAEVVAGEQASAVRPTTVRLHGGEAEWVQKAVDRGYAIHLALFDWDGGEERVLAAVVRSDSGAYYFASPCGARFAQPLRNDLGDGFDEAIDAIIGVTDAAQILAVLEPDRAPAPSQRPIIGVNVDPKGLTRVSLVLIPPAEVPRDLVLCSALERGSNECVSLALLEGKERVSMDAWVSPKETLTLDMTGSSGYPAVGTFGAVKLDFDAIEAAEKAGGAIVVLELTGDIAADGAVTDGRVRLLNVFAFDDLADDVERLNQVFEGTPQ